MAKTPKRTVKKTVIKKAPAKKLTTETRKFSKQQKGTGDGGPKDKLKNN